MGVYSTPCAKRWLVWRMEREMMYMTCTERVCSGFSKEKGGVKKNITKKEKSPEKMATLKDLIELMWAIKLVQ